MSTVQASSSREHRTTVLSLAGKKRRGERISMLTAYDFAFARIFDAARLWRRPHPERRPARSGGSRGRR